jgi:hypothetical protein
MCSPVFKRLNIEIDQRAPEWIGYGKSNAVEYSAQAENADGSLSHRVVYSDCRGSVRRPCPDLPLAQREGGFPTII